MSGLGPNQVGADYINRMNQITTFSVFDKTVAPTINDDSDDEFEVGSIWIDINNNIIYTCMNPTVGAAVWVVNAVGGGGFLDDSDFPANGTMERTGAGVYQTTLFKRDATVAPTVNDDTGAGYTVGSRWVDVVGGKEYVCLDNSAAAAVWTETTGGGGGGGGDSTLVAFQNYSTWVDDSSKTLALSPSVPIGKVSTTVLEEVPQEGVTNADWQILADDTAFDLEDSAYAQTITPSATSGQQVIFTLGGGTWSAADVGKKIVNISGGESGVGFIIAQGGGTTCTAIITTAFTDTNAIASGDWELYKGDFTVNGEYGPAGDSYTDWATWDGLDDGPESQLTSINSSWGVIDTIDSGRALTSWQTTGKGTCAILSKSGNVLNKGTETDFEVGGSTTYQRVIVLDSTYAVILYVDGGDSSHGAAVCVEMGSGTTIISTGTKYTFDGAGAVAYIEAAKLSATKVAILYSRGGLPRVLVIERTSGTTLSGGSSEPIDVLNKIYMGIMCPDSTHACAFHRATGDDIFSTFITITGTTVILEPSTIFDSSNNYGRATACFLSSTEALVGFRKTVFDGGGMGVIHATINIGAKTITAGTPSVVEPGVTDITYPLVYKITPTLGAIAYLKSGNGYLGVFSISGATITPETVNDFTVGVTTYYDLCVLDETAIVSRWRRASDDRGVAQISTQVTGAYHSSSYVATHTNNDGQIATDHYTDLNSMAATEVLGGESMYYAVSVDGRQVWKVCAAGEGAVNRIIASDRNIVHGNGDGNWYVNIHTTFGSETWDPASPNTAFEALEAAMAIAANQMTSTDLTDADDLAWPAFGTVFDLAMIAKTDDSTIRPVVASVTFNYDAGLVNRDKTHEYIVDQLSTTSVRVTSPSSGGPRNARVMVVGL